MPSWAYKRGFLVLAVSASLVAVTALPQTASTAVADPAAWADRPFLEFVEGTYSALMRRDPDALWDATGLLAAAYGVDSFAEMTDISPEALDETRRIEEETLRLLRRFDRGSLSLEEAVSYDAYEWLLEDRIAAASYPLWDACVGPSTYGAPMRQILLFDTLPIRDLEDARDYVARLRSTTRWMAGLIGALRTRAAVGAIPTLYVLQQSALELTQGILQEDARDPDPRQTEAYKTFAARLETLSDLRDAERAQLLGEASAAIHDDLIPAFRALRDVLVELQRVASSDAGLGRRAGGSAYYQQLLDHYVGTGAGPEALHARGRAEVARLDTRLRDAAFAAFGWPRDLPMAELSARIDRADSTRLEGEALRAEYEALVIDAELALPTFFGRLPSTDLEWLVDPQGPPAYYQAPPLDSPGPGTFVVSLLSPTLGTAYDEAALVHHETFPGHHLQFALAADLQVPSFQRLPVTPVCVAHPAFQALTEGWALYAEELAAEMGLYAGDPIADLWRLRLQLTQVVRIVADTGMNALGWTWPQAAAYLETTLGARQRQSVQLRYESAPGQACGYAAGYFLLLDLRARAQALLGDRFDVRAFHDEVLAHGALPLPVLELVIDAWIARVLADG